MKVTFVTVRLAALFALALLGCESKPEAAKPDPAAKGAGSAQPASAAPAGSAKPASGGGW